MFGSLFSGGLQGLGAGLSTLGGPLLNFFGQQQANAQNEYMNERNIQFATQEARETRDFQSWMRSTAYQATRDDLEKAGFNPLLALNNGATNTPSGAMASPPSQIPMQNELSGAVQSAFSGMDLIRSLKNTEADVALKNAQATTQVADAYQKTANADVARKQARLLDATFEASKAKADLDIDSSKWDRENLDTQKMMNLIQQGVGTVGSALNPIGNIIDNLSKKKWRKNDTDIRGMRGVPVP